MVIVPEEVIGDPETLNAGGTDNPTLVTLPEPLPPEAAASLAIMLS